MIPLATTPESEGVSSARLAEFVDRFFSLRWTHGLVVLRHGRVVAECYRELCSPADRHQLFSLSKSFTSSAVGIALGEGLIPSLDAPLVSFFPEYDSPRVTDRMRRVTLRHLLCMGMGRASCGLWGDRYDRLHREFGAFARAAWIAPARLRITAAVPCSTSFFTLEFDLAASRFRSRTPIWFAHPWMGDVTVPLERVLP